MASFQPFVHATLAVALAFLSASTATATAEERTYQESSEAAKACEAYFKAGDEKQAVHACKALEAFEHRNTETVSRLMTNKAAGKILGVSDFLEVYNYVAHERLATTVQATIYAHNHIDSFGHDYAVQAVGWSMYDAKNCHDLIANGSRLADFGQANLRVSSLKVQLLDDKAIGYRMERLYPGVLEESVRRVHMSVAEYKALMARL